MIAKVSVGKSFGGLVNYLYEGPEKGKEKGKGSRAELLDYNGIRPDQATMIKDFDRHRWINPDLGNAVGHIALAFHPDDADKADNAAMIRIARELMIRLKIDPDNTQYALIRHRDRDHEHCHLVYNRVDFEGITITDQYSKSRAKEAATIIARQEGLIIASEKKKDLNRTNQPKLAGHDQARYRIYEAIRQELPQSTSIEQFTEALNVHQIETQIQKNGTGMSFKLGKNAFKASEIDREFTGGKIHKTISQQHDYQMFDELATMMKERDQARQYKEIGDEWNKLMKERENAKKQSNTPEKVAEPTLNDQKISQQKPAERGPKL